MAEEQRAMAGAATVKAPPGGGQSAGRQVGGGPCRLAAGCSVAASSGGWDPADWGEAAVGSWPGLALGPGNVAGPAGAEIVDRRKASSKREAVLHASALGEGSRSSVPS